jgi:hypothetical protein
MDQLPEQARHGEPLLRAVAEDLLNLGAHVQGVRARIVEVVDIRDERELLDERPVAKLGGPLALLGFGPLADVSQRRGEDRRAGDVDP